MQRATTSTLSGPEAFPAKDDLLWDGDYLARVVASQSYRSLRRFIAGHVAPHADSRIRRLLQLNTEKRVEALVRDPRALAAWAVALWSMDLECNAKLRLWEAWEDLRQPTRRECVPRAVLDRDSMGITLSVSAPSGPLRVAQGTWLLQHATLAVLRYRFGLAQALALGMAQAHDGELSKGMLGRNRLELTAEVLPSGGLRFTVEAEATAPTLVPRPHRSKNERRRLWEEAKQQRLQALRGICSGPCLRFTWRDGWEVVSSSVPDVADGITIRKNRLFAEGRPAFVLFAAADGYCARVIDAPLEVVDGTPWKAVDTLRHAFSRYRKHPSAHQAEQKARVEVSKVACLGIGDVP